jgi:hypothetical protein
MNRSIKHLAINQRIGELLQVVLSFFFAISKTNVKKYHPHSSYCGESERSERELCLSVLDDPYIIHETVFTTTCVSSPYQFLSRDCFLPSLQ